MEEKEIQQKALALPDQVRTIIITDQATLEKAEKGLLYINGLEKEVDNLFDPILKDQREVSRAANEALTKARASNTQTREKRDSFKKPLTEAKEYLKGIMSAYFKEQEGLRRAREEEERKKQEELQKKVKEEEDRRMKEALKAEEAGDHKKAEEILDKMPEPPAELVSKAPARKPQLSDSHTRTNWQFKITDPTVIPREFLEVDKEKMNDVVVPLLKHINIPGIEAVEVSWKWLVTDIAKVPRKLMKPNNKLIASAVRTQKEKTAIPGIKPIPETNIAVREKK